MYARKAWEDARGRLLIYALACLAIGVLMGMMGVTEYHYARRWLFGTSKNWDPVRIGWLMTYYSLMGWTGMAAAWAGLALASHGAGKEYGEGAMPFLLTRPGRRSRLAWTDWGLGASAQGLVFAALLVGASPFFNYFSDIAHEPLRSPLLLAPGALLLGFLAYGMTQLLTALTGSSFRGMNLTIIIAATFVFIPQGLKEWWKWDTLMRFRDWSFEAFLWGRKFLAPTVADEAASVFPYGPFAFWLVLVIAFPLLTQVVFARRQL